MGDEIVKETLVVPIESNAKPFSMTIPGTDLRDILKVVDPLVSEFKIEVTETGIKMVMVDPAHVAMLTVDYKVPVNAPVGTVIGVDLEDLEMVVKAAKKQNITFALSPDGGKLEYKIGDAYGGAIKTVPTDEMPTPKVPNIVLSTSCPGDAARMSVMCKASQTFTDFLTFEDMAGIVHAMADSCEGTAKFDVVLGPATVTVPADSKDAPETAKSLFSLDYLSGIFKALDAIEAKSETISIGRNYPCRIDFAGCSERMTGFYLLAPRIENE